MALNHGRTAADVLTRRRMLGRAGALAAAGGAATSPDGCRRGDGHGLVASTLPGLHGHAGEVRRDGGHERDPEGAGHAVRAVRAGAARGRDDGVHPCAGAGGDRGQATDVEVLDPERRLDGGVGLFTSLAVVEAIEVSLYLVGVTLFSVRSDAFGSRLCSEALGTEAEHRVLARFAASQLGAPTAPPNNVGFEPFPYRSTAAVIQALTALGIGYGRPGSAPGAFYDYPGDPLANGVGVPVESTTPQ